MLQRVPKKISLYELVSPSRIKVERDKKIKKILIIIHTTKLSSRHISQMVLAPHNMRVSPVHLDEKMQYKCKNSCRKNLCEEISRTAFRIAHWMSSKIHWPPLIVGQIYYPHLWFCRYNSQKVHFIEKFLEQKLFFIKLSTTFIPSIVLYLS